VISTDKVTVLTENEIPFTKKDFTLYFAASQKVTNFFEKSYNRHFLDLQICFNEILEKF